MVEPGAGVRITQWDCVRLMRWWKPAQWEDDHPLSDAERERIAVDEPDLLMNAQHESVPRAGIASTWSATSGSRKPADCQHSSGVRRGSPSSGMTSLGQADRPRSASLSAMHDEFQPTDSIVFDVPDLSHARNLVSWLADRWVRLRSRNRARQSSPCSSFQTAARNSPRCCAASRPGSVSALSMTSCSGSTDAATSCGRTAWSAPASDT